MTLREELEKGLLYAISEHKLLSLEKVARKELPEYRDNIQAIATDHNIQISIGWLPIRTRGHKGKYGTLYAGEQSDYERLSHR